MGLFSGIANLFGGSKASKQQEQAYRDAAAAAEFKPYNVSNALGSSTFSNGALSSTLSPEFQAQLQNQLGMTQGAYQGYQEFNPQNYAENMYRTISAYRAPEQAMRNQNMYQDVFSSGQWGSTPGEASLYSFQNQQNLADQALRLQSQQAGASEQDRLFNLYTNALSNAAGLAMMPTKLGELGGNLGNMRSAAGARQGEFLVGAGNARANRTSNFWNSIGTIGDSLMGMGMGMGGGGGFGGGGGGGLTSNAGSAFGGNPGMIFGY